MAAPFLQISDVDPDPHGSALYRIIGYLLDPSPGGLKKPGQKAQKLKGKN